MWKEINSCVLITNDAFLKSGNATDTKTVLEAQKNKIAKYDSLKLFGFDTETIIFDSECN